MMTPRVAVLFGFGINCDHETKAVFELVGAEADRVHVNRFVSATLTSNPTIFWRFPADFRLATTSVAAG